LSASSVLGGAGLWRTTGDRRQALADRVADASGYGTPGRPPLRGV